MSKIAKEFNYDKSIRALERNAKRGNFYSAVQLNDYYRNGKFVEKDLASSEKYLQLAYNIFRDQHIKINSLKLSNFRGIENINIKNFDDNLNIFVGNNGAGKTTFLDAIDLSLSWLSISINKSGGNGNYIEENDINIYSKKPYATVSSAMQINHQLSANLELSKSHDGRIKVRNKLSDFRTVGSFYKSANIINSAFNMPLLAYYNVMRSYDVNPNDFKGLDSRSETSAIDKFDAYQKSLTGKTDFGSFVKWYTTSDHILLRRENELSRPVALDALDVSEELLERLKKLSDSNEDIRKAYIQLEEAIQSRSQTEIPADSDLERNRKIINNVVSSFMDGYSDLEVQLEPTFDLVIRKHNRKISVLRLSQGEKTLLALVLDIARRLIILNPSLDDPLKGQGIILIDEFDLHLHPKWQKTIAENLRTTFPNCQFFLTTHSPLVLSEIDRRHIYILSEDDEGYVSIQQPEQSFGLSSSQILNELMGSNDGKQIARSQFVEDTLEEIMDLIDEETKRSLNLAKDKINQLDHLIHGDIPELVREKHRLELAFEWLVDNEENK
ncbi:AAA family ATPase [Vibrio atlanticus]|uniref:AAA family ATPase n=1 Tax=Vibrio atlanticus TaxID=693153 RepID=UPI003551CE8C